VRELPTRDLLHTGDVDALAAALHLLLGELAVLTERVAVLEGRDPGDSQTRIAELTERVLAPMTTRLHQSS
jgi:hypothetical protein